jgi:uncharacterized zinc-type alcohol dehydrogenase-like protein
MVQLISGNQRRFRPRSFQIRHRKDRIRRFAHFFDAHVVHFTTSPAKTDDALRDGANELVLAKDLDAMKSQAASFNFILDTVSAPHDIDIFLSMLKWDGAMVLVGLPDRQLAV